jgi:hypothetical protein
VEAYRIRIDVLSVGTSGITVKTKENMSTTTAATSASPSTATTATIPRPRDRVRCSSTLNEHSLEYQSRAGISSRYTYERSCVNRVRWMVDGKFLCSAHYEALWDSGEFVENHRIVRLYDEDIREALKRQK